MDTKAWVKFEKIDELQGKFILSPLRPGMGITIGNSIRRVLLSSLEGAAVTSIVIDGVEHEFSSIEYVAEDVLDIICNIKGIIFRSFSSQPKKATLEFSGKGKVTAKDIKHDSELEVVNPSQPIAELTGKGTLKIEFTVEKGVGYQAAEVNKAEGQDVNVISLDASFSPIVRVNHSVNNVRVGQDLDYDSLEMEVWTNGSIDVETAVKKSASILMKELALFGDMNNEPEVAKESDDASPASDSQESGLSLSVEDLELSARSLNCLKKAGINTVGELMDKDLSELIQIKNFGKKSAEEINGKLEQYGLVLKGEPV